MAVLGRLARQLDGHARREERGVFTALKDQGEYVDAVVELEDEHVGFDAQLAALDHEASDFPQRVVAILTDLSEHIDKENLGIFPVAVVTLGATGWETVRRAEETSPESLST